jgi:hypothetical protein
VHRLSYVSALIGQSWDKGRKAVETAWATQQAIDTMQVELQQLGDTATDLELEPYEHSGAPEHLAPAHKKLDALRKTLCQQVSALGVDGQVNYQHLKTRPFIQLWMNARALKIRLRSKLTAQKFEFDRIECSTQRQQFNGMSFIYLLFKTTNVEIVHRTETDWSCRGFHQAS